MATVEILEKEIIIILDPFSVGMRYVFFHKTRTQNPSSEMIFVMLRIAS
jgi:hypothetical protein